MKNTLTTILFIFIVYLSSAQELIKEHQDVVLTFIECIQNKNVNKLKTLISFPIKRAYPLPDVKDENEFIKRYNELFDDSLFSEIIKSDLKKDWTAVGWRGIMLYNGTLWLDYDGKLLAINYQSEKERIERMRLIELDKSSIHKELVKFKQPILIMETEQFRIRIDELDNGKYRYASWPINSEMNQKPDLIIKNGHWSADGSGGNHSYEFNNGKYKYICYVNVLGTDETPPADLYVYKKSKEILAQPAQTLMK
jgi:hypothetical protein